MFSEEQIADAVRAVNQNDGNKTQAAKDLGISRSALRRRFDAASEDFLNSQASQLGFDPNSVTQFWAKSKDGSFLVKPQIDPIDIAETIKSAFEGFVSPTLNNYPSQRPINEDLLTLIPLADLHMGLFSWSGETGADWDLSIAEKVLGETIERVIAGSPDAEHCVILGGGDAVHSNNMSNQTDKSKNSLDVDTRYQKVLMAACRFFVKTIDLALQKFPSVTVRVLSGNHDNETSYAIAYFLLAWYRNEIRVEIDADASIFWWHRFGKVMLGAAHGHTVKMKDMPQVMAVRRAEDWGLTKHRYVHGFHIHHQSKFVSEGGGVICESHQSPVAQDAWHFNEAFLSSRSMQSITYHKDHGEVSRNRVAVY